MTLDLARPLFWGPFPPQPYCDYVSPELHERQGELWNLTALLRVTEVQFERNHQAPSLVFNHIWCLNEASLQTLVNFSFEKKQTGENITFPDALGQGQPPVTALLLSSRSKMQGSMSCNMRNYVNWWNNGKWWGHAWGQVKSWKQSSSLVSTYNPDSFRKQNVSQYCISRAAWESQAAVCVH